MTGSRDHLFWGVQSPLATLSGGSLMVLASGRFSFALVCAFALLWVYVFTGLALRISFMPRWEGIVPVLASFTGGLYILVMFLVSPILAMDTLFFLILCPLCCVSSGVLNRLENLDTGEAVVQSCREGVVLSALILGLSLIREPLGYGCLSLPGIQRDIVKVIEFPQGTWLPVRVLITSSGALFLLGYGIALFRRFGGFDPDSAGGKGGKP